MQGAQVQSLVRELRSHSHTVRPKGKKKLILGRGLGLEIGFSHVTSGFLNHAHVMKAQ